MTNPRKIAVDIIEKVLKGRFVDDCLASEARLAELDERDKGFVKAMINTTLRHFGEIDHFLHQFTKRKTTELYLGVAQLKFMDLPAHAVVNEMVEVSERKAFNNAVLRKAAKKDIHHNIKLNIPAWMFGAWKKAYGEEKATQIAEAAMREAGYIDISFKTGINPTLSLPSEGRELRDAPSPNRRGLGRGYLRVAKSEQIFASESFKKGEFWVQDISQRIPVDMLGDVKGLRVLDMCAAPGGKTAQLIDAGAKITALDSSVKRIERLKENLARLQMDAEIVLVDARDYRHSDPEQSDGEESLDPSVSPQDDALFDCILLDAPCTATGTLAKNPEILLQRKLEDVKELVRIQNELVENAHKLLKKGGALVYSTCSLQYEECEGLVKKLSPEKWQLESEKRTLPFDCGGGYAAKLWKL